MRKSVVHTFLRLRRSKSATSFLIYLLIKANHIDVSSLYDGLISVILELQLPITNQNNFYGLDFLMVIHLFTLLLTFTHICATTSSHHSLTRLSSVTMVHSASHNCCTTSSLMIFCVFAIFIQQYSYASLPWYYSCTVYNQTNSAMVKCWGYNLHGQLGYGHTENVGDEPNEMGQYLNPIDFGDGFIPSEIAMGYNHNCALSTEHKIKCWGANWYGQLGYGDKEHRGDGPDEMGNNLPEVDLGYDFGVVVQIAAGADFSCALSNNGYVKCWGNAIGQENTIDIGDDPGEMGDNLTTIDLGSNFTVTKISSGLIHICALSDHGTIKCWGNNDEGQCGYGDYDNRGWTNGTMGDALLEIDLGTDFAVKDITVGYRQTCAVSTNNQLKCWGRNARGQLGYGHTDNIGDNAGEMGNDLAYVELGEDFVLKQISAGREHTCAVSESYTIKCWGANFHGSLGYGDQQSVYNYTTRSWVLNMRWDPYNLSTIDLGSNFNAEQIIIAGWEHTCALSTMNKIKCWGYNIFGQLGYGDTDERGSGPNEMGDYLPIVWINGNAPTQFPTADPTKKPTNLPSYEPSIKPSKLPTNTPTNIPTHPTAIPTHLPTNIPTADPTTMSINVPSNTQSMMSNTPTTAPTMTTIASSIYRTKFVFPNNSDDYVSTTSSMTSTSTSSYDFDLETDDERDDLGNNDDDMKVLWIVYYIIAACVVLCCIIFIGIIFMGKFMRVSLNEEPNDEDNLPQALEMGNVDSKMNLLRNIRQDTNADVNNEIEGEGEMTDVAKDISDKEGHNEQQAFTHC